MEERRQSLRKRFDGQDLQKKTVTKKKLHTMQEWSSQTWTCYVFFTMIYHGDSDGAPAGDVLCIISKKREEWGLLCESSNQEGESGGKRGIDCSTEIVRTSQLCCCWRNVCFRQQTRTRKNSTSFSPFLFIFSVLFRREWFWSSIVALRTTCHAGNPEQKHNEERKDGTQNSTNIER